jgi:hypothetical protein
MLLWLALPMGVLQQKKATLIQTPPKPTSCGAELVAEQDAAEAAVWVEVLWQMAMASELGWQ